jgi:DNA-binding LacI/PurR family transcriptional regulator
LSKSIREAMELLLDIVEGRGDAHSNIEIPLRLIARELS